MTPRPTRATVAGRAYLDLRNLAQRQGRLTDELHQIYALEGFLARMVISPYADKLVLKGGVLLAGYGARRATRDIDLQASRHSNTLEDVLTMVRQIATIPVEDGLLFDVDDAQASTIRDEEMYNGVRVAMPGDLSGARLSLHVDVNVGDPIWPEPRLIALPRLLHGHINVVGYPLAMIYAEKLLTAVDRAKVNTRWRDYADIYLLSRRHDIDGAEAVEATTRVAQHRQVQQMPLSVILDGWASLAQQGWARWRGRLRLEDRLPADFGEVMAAVITFADPILDRSASQLVWNARRSVWTTP